jgi:hypothetical protein
MKKVIDNIVEEILKKNHFLDNEMIYFDNDLIDENEIIFKKITILVNFKKSNTFKINSFFKKENIYFYLDKYSIKLNVDIEMFEEQFNLNHKLKNELKSSLYKTINESLIYIKKFINNPKSNLLIIKRTLNNKFPKDYVCVINFFENINIVTEKDYLLFKEISDILKNIDLKNLNSKEELEKELNLFPYISNIKKLSSYRIKEEMTKMNALELKNIIISFNKEKENFKNFHKYKIKNDVNKFCWFWGEEIIKKGNDINSKINFLINERWNQK